MARLRLFANLREAAGTGEAHLPGGTVGEILAEATARWGDQFERGLESARVWVNGEPAGSDAAVGEGDEVALIPPVSGGTTMVRSPLLMEIGLFIMLALGLIGVTLTEVSWFAVGVVLAAGLWVSDLADFAARRGMLLSAYPALLGVVGGVMATYRWGVPGMAAATGGAVLVSLLAAVLSPRLRPIASVSATMLVALIATFGTSSLLLLQMRGRDEALAFLVVTVTSVTAAWLAGQREMTGFDPVVVTLLIGIVMGVIAATVWAEDDILPMIVASLAAAVALVAGRNLGSLIRAGGFVTAGIVPGALHGFDSIILAAGPFWLIVTVFA